MWIIALIALLAGCEPASPDGYRFERSDFERDQVTVAIVQHDTRRDFENAAAGLGITAPESLAAFGTVHPTEPRCTIHVMRISRHYQPQWLGHELTHCIYGRFHGEANGGRG